MRIDIIDNTKALAGVRANWEAVYDADPEAQYFLSWEWLSKWLPAIKVPWFVLAARPDADGSAYAAFLPLWLETKAEKSGGCHNRIQMGGNYAADYTGLLCLPGQEEQAITAFADRIKQLNWTDFRLDDLRMSDRRIALLTQGFSKAEFDVAKRDRSEDGIDLSICPVASLPDDWEAYLESRLSANARQKIRRLLRQVETSDQFRITQAEKDTLGRDLDILLKFWTQRWGPQKGQRLDGILKNSRLMLRHAFDAGSLFLPVLWQGERPVGALATLVDARKRSFHFYMAGRDETFDGPQPGLVLHAHSIRHAIRGGFVAYDFLRGNEPYKYSFGVEERRNSSFAITTRDKKNLSGRLDRRSLPFALQTAMEHHRAGRRAEAERGYRQILDIDPRNADALYGLGQILQKRSEHAAAIELFQTLLAAAPETHKAWFRLGRSLRARGELAEAVGAYCEGIERQPAIAGAYSDLGQILLDLGQPDQAVAAFDAARSLRADFPGIEAKLTRALDIGAKPSARRAALRADLRERVGRLSAIATAAARDKAVASSRTDRLA